MKQKSWRVYWAAVLVAVMLLSPVTATISDGVLAFEERTAQAQGQVGYYGSQLEGASLDVYQALAAHQAELMELREIKVT